MFSLKVDCQLSRE